MLELRDELSALGFEANQLEAFKGPGFLFVRQGSEKFRTKNKSLFLMGRTPRLGNFISSLKKIYAYGSNLGGKHDVFIRSFSHAGLLKLSKRRLSGLRHLHQSPNYSIYSRIVVHQSFFDSRSDVGKLSTDRTAAGYVRKSIRVEQKTKDNWPSKEAEIVIHIRSGDIFRQNPHPGYAQPPLGFYKAVIRDEKPQNVLLIVEDFQNPVVSKLVQHLHEQGVNTDVRGSNLNQTVFEILKARVVVFGTGTFVPQLCSLSNRIEKIYTLEGFSSSLSGWLREVEKHTYACTAEEISKLKPWARSEQQMNLMTNLEAEYFVEKEV